jgi:hypothetical protein
MEITFLPIRMDAELALSRRGDSLTVNGEVFDFSPLEEGAILPADAISSDWFVGPVERRDGELHLTLLLPHGQDAPADARFPVPVRIAGDGAIVVPVRTGEQPKADDAED